MAEIDWDDWDDEGPSPADAARSLIEQIILEGIGGHERSLQTQIGPSGLGTPCPTELAYDLMGFEVENDPREEWRQAMGRAGHSQAERFIEDWKLRNPDSEHVIFSERRVSVGTAYLPGRGEVMITGTCDLYIDGVIIDFKFPGITTIRTCRKEGYVGQGYDYQSHLYGQGYLNEGFPVTHVGVLMFPVAGEWHERFWWSEPFNAVKAQKALNRATKYGKAIDEFGLETVLDETKRVDNYCHRCPWALPGEWPQCPTAPEAKPGRSASRSPKPEPRSTRDLFR